MQLLGTLLLIDRKRAAGRANPGPGIKYQNDKARCPGRGGVDGWDPVYRARRPGLLKGQEPTEELLEQVVEGPDLTGLSSVEESHAASSCHKLWAT